MGNGRELIGNKRTTIPLPLREGLGEGCRKNSIFSAEPLSSKN
jgi:hypothetical protein